MYCPTSCLRTSERRLWSTRGWPIKPNGVVHQHFNHAPGEPCLWIAFIYMPIMDSVSMEMTQIEAMPEFRDG